MSKRRTFSAEFKKTVAIAALREHEPLTSLAQKFKLHPVQIEKWKSNAIDGMQETFLDSRKKTKEPDIDIESLYSEIGKLKMQLDFLKKKTGIDYE